MYNDKEKMKKNNNSECWLWIEIREFWFLVFVIQCSKENLPTFYSLVQRSFSTCHCSPSENWSKPPKASTSSFFKSIPPILTTASILQFCLISLDQSCGADLWAQRTLASGIRRHFGGRRSPLVASLAIYPCPSIILMKAWRSGQWSAEPNMFHSMKM